MSRLVISVLIAAVQLLDCFVAPQANSSHADGAEIVGRAPALPAGPPAAARSKPRNSQPELSLFMVDQLIKSCFEQAPNGSLFGIFIDHSLTKKDAIGQVAKFAQSIGEVVRSEDFYIAITVNASETYYFQRPNPSDIQITTTTTTTPFPTTVPAKGGERRNKSQIRGPKPPFIRRIKTIRQIIELAFKTIASGSVKDNVTVPSSPFKFVVFVSNGGPAPSALPGNTPRRILDIEGRWLTSEATKNYAGNDVIILENYRHLGGMKRTVLLEMCQQVGGLKSPTSSETSGYQNSVDKLFVPFVQQLLTTTPAVSNDSLAT